MNIEQPSRQAGLFIKETARRGGGKSDYGLLAQKPWIVPIPGSRKLERLEENIGSVFVDLTTTDLSDIKETMSKIAVVGDRY